MKNRIKIFLVLGALFTGCSSINLSNINMPNFSTTPVPARINEAIASRVNPESEIYSLGKANLSKSGAIVAQARANKDAMGELRNKIGNEVDYLYKSYINDMDSYSKSIVSPVVSDLKKYATDLSVKKISQKGAWQDNEKIYSLLVVDKKEVHSISQKVFKNFTDNAAKKLENIGTIVK